MSIPHICNSTVSVWSLIECINGCFQGVRCVIHYQIPASVDIYVHRSGRTARADADGLAIALVAPKEAPRYAALQQVCPNLSVLTMLNRKHLFGLSCHADKPMLCHVSHASTLMKLAHKVSLPTLTSERSMKTLDSLPTGSGQARAAGVPSQCCAAAFLSPARPAGGPAGCHPATAGQDACRYAPVTSTSID